MSHRSIQRDAWGFVGYGAAGFVLAAALVGLASCGASRPVLAHSWYPYDCCSDQDCWPMGDDADAREPDPTREPGGYVTFDGRFVPESETRPSPDGRFHVCRRGADPTGPVIWPSQRPVCLFVPRPNS